MKNQNHMVINSFSDKKLLSFQRMFLPKCEDTNGAWNVGLNWRLASVSDHVMTIEDRKSWTVNPSETYK